MQFRTSQNFLYFIDPESSESCLSPNPLWEIQDILSERFDIPMDDVLTRCKENTKSIIAHYIGADEKKENALRLFLHTPAASIKDFVNEGIERTEVEELTRDMVKNNVLYFDPTTATYYPQGKSYQWGIRLYFQDSNPAPRKKRKTKKQDRPKIVRSAKDA